MVSSTVDFSKQYNLSYISRLDKMKGLIVDNPVFKEYNLDLKNLSEDLNDECIVIAIFFVDSKNKPSILRNRAEQTDNYLDESQFYIEDMHGRILLSFTNSFNKLNILSSGMVLGFIGYRNEKSIFVCSDIVLPVPLIPKPRKLQKKNSKILFMSNISVNDGNFERVRMALDYFYNKVEQVVIFGNIFTNKKESFPDLSDLNQILSSDYPKINIVPNLNDPSTKMIPIEPFHKMIFSEKISNLNLLPHPVECNMLGSDFILMNSYIIEDLKKYAIQTISYLEVMEELIKLRYLAPNSPDTISSVPFFKDDPLIINNCNYLIIGGSENLEFKKIRDVFLLTVPDFNLTHSVVVLDLETDYPEEIFFEL